MNNLKRGLAVVLAAATAFTFAPVADIAAPAVAQAADDVKDTTEVSYDVKGVKTVATSDDKLEKNQANKTVTLDTVINKTSQISVANTSSAIYYMPADSSVVSVNPASGTSTTVTALKKGSTNVQVKVGSTSYTIPVEVDDQGSDVVKAQVNGKDVTRVTLDVSSSTARNAIKSVKITGVSQSSLPVTYDLYSEAADGKAINGNSNSTASVAADGTVTAGKTPGTVYVKVYTTTSNGRNIKGDTKWVEIDVKANAEAEITAPSVIKLDFKNNSKVDLSKIVSTNAKNATPKYSIKAYDKQNDKAVTLTGNELAANQIGEATLVITVPGGTDTRETTKEVTVTVVNEITKAVPVITVKPNVRLTVGSTSALGATTSATGAAITYTSDNNDVASVDATGIVTAKSAGIATITVKSAATADFEEGVEDVTVIVDPQTVPAVKPGTVKNLKVKNAKGAKVKVTWADQGGNIIYRVYKKVGSSKKWTSKDVVKANTTFSVKKGAKITVKVKAYVKDPVTGKVTWGPKATTAKAFKTDKK